MNEALTIAQTLLIPNRIAPLPIFPHSKRATVKWGQWQAEGIPAAQLPLFFRDETCTVAAICGAASENLVVFDCDSERAFDHYRNALGDPETWVVKSARGGHIWFRSTVPVKSQKKDADMQILAQGCYVMAPGAQHPTGQTYEFVKHPRNILTLPTLHPLENILLEPIRVRPTGMPRRAWKLLNGQAVSREYHSDSEREMAAICAMVNSGMEFTRIHNAFVRLAGKSTHFGRWMTEHGQRSAETMLDRMYRKALAFTAHDSPERKLAKSARAYLLDNPLIGRTGVYDQIVLDCVLRTALHAGSLSVAMGVRDLGEDAGISKEAAGKALRRLRERGWLELETEWVGPFSNIYRILPPQTLFHNLYTPPNELNVRKCIGYENEEISRFFGHDAFRWGAMSKSAAQCLDRLLSAALTQKELAVKTGRSPATISRAVDVLQALALIEPHDLRGNEIVWKAKPDLDLNAVARFYETSGKRAAQERKHDDQRGKYQAYLEQFNDA